MQSRSEFCYPWAHCDDALQVKTGPGVLHTIVINQMGAQMTIQIFDGIGGGTIIGVLTTDFDEPVTLKYDLEFEAGLYILAQYCDLTITYV